MNQTIALGTAIYSYTLRKYLCTRRIRVSVLSEGTLAVSVPIWVSDHFIRRFLKAHEEWIKQAVARIKAVHIRPSARDGKLEYIRYKEAARSLAEERLAYFNKQYGFHYGQISIRNQKTRWGSCSRSGNLSFNYRIALLPSELADYVILHELCHLGVFDHSLRFWSLVECGMSDYRERRRNLRYLSIGRTN